MFSQCPKRFTLAQGKLLVGFINSLVTVVFTSLVCVGVFLSLYFTSVSTVAVFDKPRFELVLRYVVGVWNICLCIALPYVGDVLADIFEIFVDKVCYRIHGNAPKYLGVLPSRPKYSNTQLFKVTTLFFLGG